MVIKKQISRLTCVTEKSFAKAMIYMTKFHTIATIIVSWIPSRWSENYTKKGYASRKLFTFAFYTTRTYKPVFDEYFNCMGNM